MTRNLVGVAIFLVAVYVLVPWGIAASGRWDFYYTLTSVALLAIASRRGLAHLLHRPHQHRAGRLRAGRRLRRGDPRHQVRHLLLVDAVRRRPLLRRGQPPHRPAHPAAARRLLRHGDPRADRGRPPHRPRPLHHQRRQRHHLDPAARRHLDLRPDARPRLRHPRQPQALLLLRRRHADDHRLCRPLAAGELAHRQPLPLAAAERGARLLHRRQRHRAAPARLLDLLLPRRPRRRDVHGDLAVDLSRPASPSPTRSTSC